MATLEDNNILNNTTVCVLVVGVAFAATVGSLGSHCEDCWMNLFCPFGNLVYTWHMDELSKKYANAYLILCQKFNIPNDVIKIIEDHNEESYVRLCDALHRICHKNLNLTKEEVIEIISNGKA